MAPQWALASFHTWVPSTQLPVVPPLTTVTTVHSPPAPPSSSSPPLTWEAVLGAITAAVQCQASESSVSLHSAHALSAATSITSGKSGHSHSFKHSASQPAYHRGGRLGSNHKPWAWPGFATLFLASMGLVPRQVALVR